MLRDNLEQGDARRGILCNLFQVLYKDWPVLVGRESNQQDRLGDHEGREECDFLLSCQANARSQDDRYRHDEQGQVKATLDNGWAEPVVGFFSIHRGPFRRKADDEAD